jgi:hypothetical protein
VVARIYADEPASQGTDGPDPEFIAALSQEGVDKALRGVLHRLVNEGNLETSDVVILTQSRETKDRLVGSKPAGMTLETIEERTDGVAVDTIHRHKGLEATAAVVILDRLEKPRDRALAYIGLSRPRVQLVVIGPPEVGEVLGMTT